MLNVRRFPLSHESGRLPVIKSSLAARTAAAARVVLFSEIETASSGNTFAGSVAASVAGPARQLAVPAIQAQPAFTSPVGAAAVVGPCGAAAILARRSGQATPPARAGGLLREHGRAGQVGRQQSARRSQTPCARDD